MKIRELVLLSFVSSVVLASCGGSDNSSPSGSNGAGSGSNASGSGQSPSWVRPTSTPAKGDSANATDSSGSFTYNFKETVNGVTCNPGAKQFNFISDYCHGLANDSLNRDPKTGEVCNAEIRVSTFEANCAPKGYAWPTTVDEPSDPSFPPVFAPTPRPTATPFLPPLPPAPPMDNRPQVFKDFESYGISVTVDRNPTSAPGQRPFAERLNNFLPALQMREGYFYTHTRDIQSVVLSTYTEYNEGAKRLTVDVDMNDQDLVRYFGYFDRIHNVEGYSRISIDLGIAEYGTAGSGDVLGEFASNVAYLETSRKLLSDNAYLVSEIVSDDATSYSLNDHVLHVDRARFQDSLNSFLTAYQQFFASVQYAIDQHVVLVGNLNLNDRKNTDLFKALTIQIENTRSAVLGLISQGKLSKIEFTTNTVYPSLDAQTKTLHLATQTNVNTNEDVINAISYQAVEEQLYGYAFRNDFDQLGTNYLKDIARLKQFTTVIYQKRNAVRMIRLGQNSAFTGGTLTIGYSEADDKFSQLLSTIH